MTDHYDEEGDRLHIDRVPMQILARHLSLPKLRKVQVENTLLRPLFDEMRRLPPGSSCIDDLRFLTCCEKEGDRIVAALLCSVKCLKRFVFEVSSQYYRTARPRTYADAFEHALSIHQGTIEELAVVTSEGSSMISWTLGPFTQRSSLKR